MEATGFLTFREVLVKGHCIRPGSNLPEGYSKGVFTNDWNGKKEEVITKDGTPLTFATPGLADAQIAKWS